MVRRSGNTSAIVDSAAAAAGGTDASSAVPDAAACAVLDVFHVGFGYREGRPVLRDVSFSVESGQVLVILGANGAGKSTLLDCIVGLYAPTSGSIFLEGRDVKSIAAAERARRIAYVPQESRASFGFSVQECLAMGRAPHVSMMSMPTESDYELVDRVMRRLRIEHLANSSFNEISGGERQQVLIGRAIVQDPELIIMDEPTNHLDFGNQLKVLDLIGELVDEGLSVLMTSHMPDHAIVLEGKVGLMVEGCMACVGDALDVVTTKAMRDLYGADIEVIPAHAIGRPVCTYGRLRLRRCGAQGKSDMRKGREQ